MTLPRSGNSDVSRSDTSSEHTLGRQMERAEAMALQTRLLEVFRIHKLDVAVGITSSGVMIGSQDERVDAKNLGEVTVQKRSVPPTREELLGDG